jgi:sulfite reductase (NADPH) flavoprotein alpha-component
LSSANSSPKGAFSPIPFSEPKIFTGKGYSRLEPVTGYITDIINMNDIDSNKQTYHIEITCEDTIVYTPGDAIGIVLPRDEKGQEITPRLYSIASAPSFHKNQIHLTVALATYVNDKNEMGYGMTSSYLANRQLNDKINFYVHQNHLFNLPSDDQNIIMIGPGTGIAPFRSFIYERLELGHTGRNWLFFGHQYAHCDFLYQAEWQEHLATGVLHSIDLAFSRDQDSKIYVQHRLQEKAKDVFSWLEEGAAIYICGAKDPMSKDVEQRLIDIIATQKSFSQEQSKEYLANLEEQNRYVKDVY